MLSKKDYPLDQAGRGLPATAPRATVQAILRRGP
jgi:hypothetical protein